MKIQDLSWVFPTELIEHRGHGDDDLVVRDRKQFLLPVPAPLLPTIRAAVAAVPVSTSEPAPEGLSAIPASMQIKAELAGPALGHAA